MGDGSRTKFGQMPMKPSFERMYYIPKNHNLQVNLLSLYVLYTTTGEKSNEHLERPPFHHPHIYSKVG